jgi:hypothetical protein
VIQPSFVADAVMGCLMMTACDGVTGDEDRSLSKIREDLPDACFFITVHAAY